MAKLEPAETEAPAEAEALVGDAEVGGMKGKARGKGRAVGGGGEEEEGGAAGSVTRILLEARFVWARMAVGSVFLLLSSVATMALPYLAGRLLDVVAEASAGTRTVEDSRDRLNSVILALVGVSAISGFSSGVRAYFFNSSSELVVARLRRRLLESLLSQEVGFFDAQKTGDLISRLTADIDKVKEASTTNVSIFLRTFVNIVVGLVAMFITSWRLTLLALAVTPVTFVAVGRYGRYIRRLSQAVQKVAADAAAQAGDSLGAIRTVKYFAREEQELAEFGLKVDETVRKGFAQVRAASVFAFCTTTVSMGVIALVFWYGANEVIDGEMTVGELQAFVLYAISIGAGLSVLGAILVSLYQAVGASARVFQLIDREPLLAAHGTETPLRKGTAIPAELEDVHFAYPSRPDTYVLRGLTLSVPAGRTVALVGSSGSGKSTVTSLLERLYDPQKGTVRLAGMDVRDIDRVHLHSALGIVNQEPVMLARTLRENLVFGHPDATEEQIAEACRKANAMFVYDYSEQLETYVGERGIQLSGGQKQRVAIARALLADPRFLLLDEATSALDSESEHLVVAALDNLMLGRSALVIAHRLSTVQGADVVAVLADGVVAESGTHDELLAREKGAYRALVKRQLSSMTPVASSASLAEEE